MATPALEETTPAARWPYRRTHMAGRGGGEESNVYQRAPPPAERRSERLRLAVKPDIIWQATQRSQNHLLIV